MVNWIKWALAGHALEPHWLDSLAIQARHLAQRLEYHLLGNHLFANAKALVFAGLFFSGPEANGWLDKPPETNAPATRTYEHARQWVCLGHPVTVITGAPNFPEGKVFPGYRNRWYAVEDLDGIRVVRVKTYITANEGFLKRTLDYLSFMASGFIAGLFQQRPDIIVGTSPQFFTNLGAWLLATVRRKPYVFELRDLWPASSVDSCSTWTKSSEVSAMTQLLTDFGVPMAAIVPETNSRRTRENAIH
jgi:colanic acid biosynthesis glycosyl transferase WcaI